MLPASQLPKDLRVKTGVDYDALSRMMVALANPDRLRLLPFLTRPHYLEEVASEMGISRQGARKHLDVLLEGGLVRQQPGVRDTGPVTEFVLEPQALFLLQDEVEKLGSLRRGKDEVPSSQTLVAADGRDGVRRAHLPGFVTVRGLEVGRRHDLAHNERRAWVLGRGAPCEVPLGYDPYASKRHAEIRWTPGGFVLQDLGSTNGTLLNWVKLPSRGEAALRHGDLVSVGKSLLLFTLPS